MRKAVMAFWLVILNLLLFANVSIAANISNANYGSAVVRDGVFNNIFGLYAFGHSGVVIKPPFGKSPKPTDYIIAQASGTGLSNVAKYSGFLGSKSNHYIGQFKTSDSQWNSPAFRADVVKFANQAMGKSYIFFALYSYAANLLGYHPISDSSGHRPNHPYMGVIPNYFRCDGVPEWSVEQALGLHGKQLDQNIGFYSNNNFSNNPISISTLGTDDSAFTLTISSNSPSAGVVVMLNKADSLGHRNVTTGGAGNASKRLYSVGTTVTLTAPATAPNGNVFSIWWGCTAANGGTLNIAARTCTTNMNKDVHYKASYVSPGVTKTKPRVVATSATLITSGSAKLNATITSNGGSTILDRRFEWNTKPDFSGSGSATNLNGGRITFSGNNFSYLLTGLTSNITYYFRPWVRNSIGWAPNPPARSFTTGTGSPPVSYYTITVSASFSAGGSVSGSGTYAAGSLRTVTVTPNSGYTFAGWSGYAGCASQSSCTFRMPASSVNLVAYFTATPVNHTIAVSASPSAGGSVSGRGTSAAGGSHTVTATPYRGYTFTRWGGYAGCASQNPCTFSMPASSVNLVAYFTVTPVRHTIAVSATAGGSVSGRGTYAAGDLRTVTATPYRGYTFTRWGGYAECASQSSCTFSMPASSVNLVAYFTATPVSHTVAVSASPSAGGSVSGRGTYTAGSSHTVTATPNRGYTFAGWSGYAGCASQSSCTFSMPTSAVNLVAYFTATPVRHTIAVSATAGGSVRGGGTSYTAGSSHTVTATPNRGYTFAGWSGYAGCTSQNPCTFSMPTSAVNLVAHFTTTPVTYTIAVSASSSAGGSVSGRGTYTAGSLRTVTATPKSGYTFAGWSGYAGCTSQNPCTFRMPASAVNLIAHFTATGATSVITSAATRNGTLGQTFSYQITATNSPTSYGVSGSLPPGLSINPNTGLISGTPTVIGTFTITVNVTNAVGTSSMPVTIKVQVGNTFIIQPGPSSGKDTCYGTVYVANGCPNARVLYIGGWGDTYYDFFEFNLSGAPSSNNIAKVELWLYAGAPNDPAMQISRITQPWTEAGITHSNNPTSTFYKNMSSVTSTRGWVVTDITSIYKGWKDGLYLNYGIKLSPTSINHTNGLIASSNNLDPNIRPKLVITLSSPAVIPGAPTIVTATASNASVSVSFTTPANAGSSLVTGYRVTSNPAGGVDTNAGTTTLTHTITGLTNGTAYTFTVTATNSAGTSPASAASNSVIPGKTSQTISFGTVPTIAAGRTGMVSATATSGLAVSFSSTTPTICTVSGGTITGARVGVCTIAADQAGDASYNAASRVTQNITVMAPLIIKGGTGVVLSTKQTVAPTGSLTVTPTGGSGSFAASITSPANAVTNLAANANGHFTFRPPTTGAFAGDYTLKLTDARSNLSTTLAINVPLKVTASRLNILESDHTQTVTVSGGAAYDVFNAVVLNVAKPGPNGKPTPDTNVNKIAANILSVTAVPDAAKGNPATATIIPANVTASTPFAVQVTDYTQPALAVAQSRRMNIIAENRVTLTVTDANTHAPIKGARVALHRPDPIIARSNATTTTNAQGVATPTLPIGPLVFDVTATGYLPGTIPLAQGAVIGAVTLTPITSTVNYTGTINTVAPFTLPADTRVTALDASGHKVVVNIGSATRFTLPLDANTFVPVRFIATATGAISDVQLVPASGTIVPAFTLRAKPAAVPGIVLNADLVPGKPTANAGEETFTAGASAGGAPGATSVEVLGKPTASIDKAKPRATGSVTVTDNQPVIEVLMKRGSIISAPVVYQKLVDANGNKRRKDAGTKPMVVGGATDTFNIPALTAVSNVRVYLPVNAFKAKDAAGNALAVGQIFTTVSGVASTSTVGRDKAKLTGGDIVEIDMVAFDDAGNVLSTAVGNTNLDKGMEIRIPIDPSALAAAGFDATTANAAFASGKLMINTASTIANFEAGKVTVVSGPVTYNPLTGEAVFFARHFSAFGASTASAPASATPPTPTSGGAGAVTSGSSGGCTLSPTPRKVDPILPLLTLIAAMFLWWRRQS